MDGPMELIWSCMMVWDTSGSKFLHACSDSYKNFKSGYLSLEAGDTEVPFWLGADGSLRFPFE